MSQFIEMFGNCKSQGTLSSLCATFIDGDWIESKDQSDNGIRLIQTGNVGFGFFKGREDKSRYITEETFKKLNCTEVVPGDILISRLPDPIGRACIVPEGIGKAITAVDCTIVRLNATLLPEFLISFSKTALYASQINKIKTGTTRLRVSRGNLGNVIIPIPPIESQHHFAAIAQQADKSEFVGCKSQFIEMFGDPMTNTKTWVEFGYIGNYTQIVLGTTPNSKNSSYWNGEIKWITPAEMTEESYYIYDTERHLTEEGLKAANLTLLPCRSVLFSTRAPIGKVGLVGSPMYCNQGFKNFVCGDQLNPVYLYYSLIFKREYLVSLGTGTTFKELSKKAVENLKIAVPPLILQNKFEEIYQQADKSEYYN